MKCIRVLVVDDAPEFLDSALQVLTRDSRTCVVGAAASGGDAVRLVESLEPDLVLMDVVMPEMNGFTATTAIKQRRPGARVWLMSLHTGPEFHRHAALAGAEHFIDKQVFQDAVTALLDRWEE